MAYLMAFAVTATTLFSDVNMLTAYADNGETAVVESAEAEDVKSVDSEEEAKESPEGEDKNAEASLEAGDATENKNSGENKTERNGK